MTDVALAPRGPGEVGGALEPAEFEFLQRVGRALAASRMFKDAAQAEQALAKILLGRDLGLSPTQAMTAIHLVEGKPELSANLQAAMLRAYRGPEGERYDFRRVELTDQACELRFLHRPEPGAEWEDLGTERFTIEDAQRAELAGKAVWKRYPRNMLFARCLSNGVAFYCPEVTFGHRVYGPGEVAEREPEFDPTSASLRDREPEAEQIVDVPDDATAGGADDEIVDAEVVADEPEPERDPPSERIVAAYNAAGRPASSLRALLDAHDVDYGGGLLAAVRALDAPTSPHDGAAIADAIVDALIPAEDAA